jgi:hypothetical protein
VVSDALVEEVRARADLVEICGEHVSLKRVGKSYRGPCPLHGGEGPNFSIDAERGIYKCFVCGEGGDVFSFVMQRLGLDFPEAVRYVAERVGVVIPDERDRGPDPYAGLREVTAASMTRRRIASRSDSLRRVGEGSGMRRASAASTKRRFSRSDCWPRASEPLIPTIASGTASSSPSGTCRTARWASGDGCSDPRRVARSIC